jgi:RimJ/RimL family protein N-acetyltransferase
MIKLVPLPDFEPQLVSHYLRWFSDPEIAFKIAPTGGLPSTALGVVGWMKSAAANTKEKHFTIVWDEDGREKALGSCALVQLSQEYLNAGINIFIGEKEWRGKGLGKYAMQLLINYAFTQLQLKRLFLGVDSENFAAIKTYIKCGFVEVARHNLLIPGAASRCELLMELQNPSYQ